MAPAAITIELPRETDGVGAALRRVYAASPSLPGEWAVLLDRIEARAISLGLRD